MENCEIRNAKMSFSWLLLAVASFCLASKDIGVTKNEELYVVKNHATNELTCISEDDDAALVWNYDLNTSARADCFNNFEPFKQNGNISSESNCAVRNSGQCFTKWNKPLNWNKVSALEEPMAPVIDYRWEGFKEYIVGDVTLVNELLPIGEDSTVVFSVRGTRDVQIHLCQDPEFQTSICSVIKLAVGGKYSVIENCQSGAARCHEEARNEIHKTAILDAHEWRTFRLQWTGSERKINIFRCTHDNVFLQSDLRESQLIRYIWISSGAVARMRFHVYNYLLTNTSNSKMNTATFDWSDNHFCIKMLVSLCPKCRLKVGMRAGPYKDVQNITGDEQFCSSKLRTWRPVEVNFILNSSSLGVTDLTFSTRLNQNLTDIWWAIADLHLCEETNGVRMSTIALPSSDHTEVEANTKCQKLLRNKICVVDSSTELPSHHTTPLVEYVQRLTRSFPNITDCNDTSGECHQKNTAGSETKGPKLLGLIPNETNFGLHKTSNSSLSEEMRPKSVDGKTLLEQTETWLVILPILVICLLFPYLVIWYRKHKKSQVQKIHLQGVLSDRLYMTPDNSRGQLSDAQDLSSGPVNTKISEDVKEQTTHVHNVSSEPVNSTILSDWSEQTHHKQNVPLDPLYMTPIDPRKQTNNAREVSLAPVYMNSPSNLKERASHEQERDILSDPVYTKISENVKEQTMHVHNVSSEPVYLTILDDPSKQISHEKNVPLDPLYLTPIQPRKQTNNAREVSLAPVYMNILSNSKERASHEQDILSDPVYTMILENSNEQTLHVHNVSSDPVYLTILDDSSKQTSREKNVPSDSLYLTPIDPRKQINNAQKVSLAPVYMNIPNNLKEQASHEQDVSPFPVI